MAIPYMKVRNGHTNDSDFVHSDFLQKNLEISIPYLILMSIFTLVGCFGNLLVIGCLITYKPLRKVGNLFIGNLAIADFCVTSFVNPFSVLGIVKGELWFEHHPVLCAVVATICVVSCFISLLSIMGISINRYVHICRSQKIYQEIFTVRNTVLMCLSFWIGGFIIETPNHFGWNNHMFDRKNLGCYWDRTHSHPYFYIIFAIFIALPTNVILYCYYQIYLHVKRSKERVQTASLKTQKENDDFLKLTKTLCIIFVVFVACWGPNTFIMLIDRKDVVPQPIHMYSVLLAHMNSSVNSIIYGLTNKQFKTGFMKLLRMEKLLKNKIEPTSGKQDHSTKATGRTDMTHKL